MTRWLLRFTPKLASPRARLFCFPHAGVGGGVYRTWPAGLPAGLDVCAIQLPGRVGRLDEPPLTDMMQIATKLAEELAPRMDLPFAFFGHSMGAVVSTEISRLLLAAGRPLPHHLLVSGRRPPHVPSLDAPLHRLPDADFIAAMQRRYGGIPPEIARHADVMKMLLPGLRGDITALETHLPPERPPLPCPITVFGGDADPLTPRAHLDAWASETRHPLEVKVFEGGHFYLEPQRDALLAEISARLAAMLETR